jgi:hypothetical protein
VLSGSTLTVTLSGGTKEIFHVAGNSTTATLVTTADGSGDTLLTFSGASKHDHPMPVTPVALLASATSALSEVPALAGLSHGLGGDFTVPVASLAYADAVGLPAREFSGGGAAAFWADPGHFMNDAHGLTTILGRA